MFTIGEVQEFEVDSACIAEVGPMVSTEVDDIVNNLCREETGTVGGRVNTLRDTSKLHRTRTILTEEIESAI